MVNDKVCFVICPIGKVGSEIRIRSDLTFKYIIKPIVEMFGYHPIRADHINESGMITNQIIDYIIDSALVIADLTDSNPNVFYELAIRHIVEKPYIQMMKSDQPIPFDISGMRTIRFDTDLEQADIAKKELSEQIDSIDNGNFKPINPVTLATNYSTAQKMIKQSGTIEPADITNVVLESIIELKSMVDNLAGEFRNSKSSLTNQNLEEIRNLYLEERRQKILILEEKINELRNRYENGRDKMSPSQLKEIQSVKQNLERQLKEIRSK